MGEHTGSPVIEDYAEKMPFKFTGGLDKVTIELEPIPLGIRGEIERLEHEAALKKALRD